MSGYLVLAFIAAVGIAAYFVAANRANSLRRPGAQLHSLPGYHGWFAFICAVLPAIIVYVCWSIGSGIYLESHLRAMVPAGVGDVGLNVGMIRTVSDTLSALNITTPDALPATYADLATAAQEKRLLLPSNGGDYMLPVALEATSLSNLSDILGAGLAIIIGAIGAAFGVSRVGERVRARNRVEQVMLWVLLGASTVAILTTIGIVLSMLGETIHFFSDVNPISFFFGTVWDPRFSAAGSSEAGQFGLIPLLAGTLYIALVSMLVAVPVGLMAAVYMGEYASPRVRGIVKPLLEVLAGIPTIVYGIFAVVTLGPFFRDLSSVLTGGHPFIQAQSVFTAGIVMGVMLIPLVSSLSDDVITAVPRAMRDGSLAIGATRSETIKRVILPAALPGIVGALLLTASRAIGETMIVVLAAGVAARLSINPFEAMTTITVKIVNQLTGDLEFNSPQTLVAFALGLTLFVLTLGMNVYALYIVRKYREQYE
jgi:phosphate transport system permease protein